MSGRKQKREEEGKIGGKLYGNPERIRGK